MWRFSTFFVTLAVLALMVESCHAKMPASLKADRYIITYEEDAQSEHWAEYLFNHLSKRTNEKTSIVLKEGGLDTDIPENVKNIHFEFATDLENDYSIEHTKQLLHIRVRSKETALWIIYQLIECISEKDNRFESKDLPPAIINFDSKCKDFDFAYREPYFASNLKPEYAPIIGTNNLETDWGLWGHNLSKKVKDAPSESVYALVDGKRNKEQLCFSSPELFESLSHYIVDNYEKGEKGPYRFMIMPDDNSLVCTCPLCTNEGNSATNATPAVAGLLNKLAQRFPKHLFFTTAYKTTILPPSDILPDNVGVFFSTINLPKGVELTSRQKETNQFVNQLKEWSNKTPHIYLWDYAANFDDYLTPIPVLYSLQKQLQFFKGLGVKGIFINAAGYDYSPFGDMKTFVAGALMMDVNCNVDILCKEFFSKKYPVSNKLISQYYLSQEQAYLSRNKAYDMYGGILQSINTYFDADKFISFYDTLKMTIPNVESDEKARLQKLFTALTYTRLQVAYVKGYNTSGYADKQEDRIRIKPEIDSMLETLGTFTKYPNLKSYKETDGSLSNYIDQWKQLIAKGSYINRLIDQPIQILSHPDEGFEKAELLHDGTFGFTTDYHQGWYLSSTDDLHLRFATGNLQKSKQIQIRFLSDGVHGIFPPERVIINIDGKQVKDISLEKMKFIGNSVECNINIEFINSQNIELKFIRKQLPKSIIACDEIVVLE